jgi:hypothetical protein
VIKARGDKGELNKGGVCGCMASDTIVGYGRCEGKWFTYSKNWLALGRASSPQPARPQMPEKSRMEKRRKYS